ncbi:MAG: prephenate dehydrogenase/arogenate dehydrogenase family protein, partial [Pseudomonadota bacterium]
MAHEFGFRRVAIIGIGLIGASMALALRSAGFDGEIVVADRDTDALAEAEGLGLGDRYLADAAAAVSDADLVILAVPVGALEALGRGIGPALGPETIVTDTGSVKAAVIDAMAKTLPSHARFVPGHPVAGSERSGPSAGFGTLFHERWTILTPTSDTDPEAIRVVDAMWRAFGARLEIMDAQKHDLVL